MSPSLIALLVQYAVQFGIPAAQQVIATLKKPDATIDDVEKMFEGVRPYSACNIPDIQPPA